MRFDNNNLEGTPNYIFTDTNFYDGNIFNEEPDFEDAFENLMRIGEDSGANGIGNSIFAGQVPFDILNMSRTASPDSGAYQSVLLDD